MVITSRYSRVLERHVDQKIETLERETRNNLPLEDRKHG